MSGYDTAARLALARHIAMLKTMLAHSENVLAELDTARGDDAVPIDGAAPTHTAEQAVGGAMPHDVTPDRTGNAEVELVAGAAPLFDAGWYLARHGLPADTDAARHYITEGAALGLDPGPLFSGCWYLDRNDDVRAGGTNPLVHYLRHGRDEGRLAMPVDDDALLRSSDLFDGDWYLRQNPDAAEAGADPADHYLATGAGRGRDPGPGFSTCAYLDRYPDVATNAFNPFVHYLRHGRVEGREADLSREGAIEAGTVAELHASPLFDAAWYLDRYPQVRDAGHDPAVDYLVAGARDGRDPCPGFSTVWYLRAYPDVAGSGINPLIHYLRNGLAEGRTPRLVPPDFATALRPASAARVRRTARAALRGATRLSGLAAILPDAVATATTDADTIMLLGTSLGRAGPGDAAVASAIEGLRHLHGLSTTVRGDLPATLGGLGVAVGDLWLVHDGLARLRIDAGQSGTFAEPLRLHAFQIEGERLVNCGEAAVGGDGPCFVDIALPNPFLPLLFVTTDAAGRVRGGALLPFPSLCRGGAHQAETGGSETDSGLPAACRLSDAVLANWRDEGDALIAAIAIDGTGATGAERIFSWPVREWLVTVARVPLGWERPGPICAPLPMPGLATDMLADMEVFPTDTAHAPMRRGTAALRLVLPADSLPTIAALFARGAARVPAGGVAGSFLVADPISGEPCFSVDLPACCGAGLPALQPADAALPFPCLFPARAAMAAVDAAASLPAGLPMAIRFHRAAGDPHRLVYRRSVDAPGPLLQTAAPAGATVTTVIVPTITQAGGVPVLLASLARQTVAAAIEVILVVARDAAVPYRNAAATRCFPERHHIVYEGEDGRGDALSRAIALAGGDHLLFVHEGNVLHDPRTVETLLTLAAAPQVASATCLHIHENGDSAAIVPGSSGLFATMPPGSAGPVLLVAAPGFAALPRATYPTAGTDLACTLVPTALWRTFDTPGGDPPALRGLAYARKALEHGYRHLATSAVTVMVATPSAAAADSAGRLGADDAPILWDGPADMIPLLRRIAP